MSSTVLRPTSTTQGNVPAVSLPMSTVVSVLRRLVILLPVLVGLSCTTQPSTTSGEITPLLETLTTTGLPDLDTDGIACATDAVGQPPHRLVELHADFAADRDLSVALSVADAYLRCGAEPAVRELLKEQFKDSSDNCVDVLDTEVLRKMVASVLIEDEQRVFTSIQRYVRCVQVDQVGATRTGRVMLAFSTTSFAQAVDEEVAACVATDLENDEVGLPGIDAALLGNLGDQIAVQSIASALTGCLNPTDLAAIVSASTSANQTCAASLVANSIDSVTELVTAYLLQDVPTGQAMVDAINAACVKG